MIKMRRMGNYTDILEIFEILPKSLLDPILFSSLATKPKVTQSFRFNFSSTYIHPVSDYKGNDLAKSQAK
jgi:hypothetical protein